MNRRGRLNPRFRILPNGTGLICGVPYPLMHDILVAASLMHDHWEKLDQSQSDKAWDRKIRWILDTLTKGRTVQDQRPLKLRLKEKREVRQMVQQLMKGIRF